MTKNDEIKVPGWLKKEGVSLLERGNQMWFINKYIAIRGILPYVPVMTPEIIHVAADWGPSGDGVQVSPGVTEYYGGVKFEGGWGQYAHRKAIDYVTRCCGKTVVFVEYPKVDDLPQMIACFRRVYPPTFMGMFIVEGDHEEGFDPSVPQLDLCAFIMPSVINPRYTINVFDMAILPKFSGVDITNPFGLKREEESNDRAE